MRIIGNLLTTTFLTGALFAPAGEGEPIGIIELGTNLGEAEKPEELPPGDYVGEVQDVQLQNSAAGNEYFSIKFRIPPSEIPADIADDFEDGAILYWNRQLKPKDAKDRRTLFNLRKLIESFGLDSGTTTVDPDEWMGQKARLKVVHGKYQGENRAEIRSLEAAEAEAAPSRAKAAAAKPAKRGRGK